jgi:putative Mn2+ efflux pump MntP
MAYGHLVAFALLCFIGGNMVFGSFRKKGCGDADGECPEDTETSIGFKHMLPLAVATSVDALAVGVSFAFVQVKIFPAILLIGSVTFLLSAFGTWVGRLFGVRFKSKAERIGGAVLILIGFKILLEHAVGL